MSQPVFVFDDDCGFCTWWAEYFDENAEFRIVGYSQMDDSTRAQLPEEYQDCSQLVTKDTVYTCGESVEAAFVRSEHGASLEPLQAFLRDSAIYAGLRERGYEFVAGNRSHFGSLVSWSGSEE